MTLELVVLLTIPFGLLTWFFFAQILDTIEFARELELQSKIIQVDFHWPASH